MWHQSLYFISLLQALSVPRYLIISYSIIFPYVYKHHGTVEKYIGLGIWESYISNLFQFNNIYVNIV